MRTRRLAEICGSTSREPSASVVVAVRDKKEEGEDDEVRNLAQRSAKAAKETADMIETSIKRSDDGVRVTEKVVTSVEEVAVKSQQLEQKLAEIVAKAQNWPPQRHGQRQGGQHALRGSHSRQPADPVPGETTPVRAAGFFSTGNASGPVELRAP